ncbi:Ataxin-1 [Bagarius yarrelli]|uniref:Ataxin-1 n=1 Tax=Bagarius yarrelli TaxID=175774 RepID=A0A556VTY2_BAGYA|nr:Ataxin-1 [Bagarius yarrelli]
MNPSLPPKKRESRQGSSEQRPPEDEFKYPAPLRHRRHHHSEGRENETRSDKELLPPPPPPPLLPHLQFPVSWQLPYHSPIHHSYLSGQVRERRSSGSPAWRDGSSARRSESETEPAIPHHSRWLRGEINSIGSHPSVPMPTYKGTYAVDSRDMWPYFSPTRRDYASSLFASSSPSHLFPQTSLYHNDYLSDSRLRYSSRRTNGLDGQGIRSESSGRAESGNDIQLRVGVSHSNGRKRNQEDLVGRDTRRISPSETGPNAHSFHHSLDRDSLAILKPPAPHTYTSETRKTKAPHEPSVGSASQSGAQIYYALGSLYSSVHHNPQAYSSFNPSGPSPSPLRNSHHGQYNNHGVHQERELSPGSYQPSLSVLSGPDPPTGAVLPHFAKGSLIELAGGRLKRVEDLQTEDFRHSADTTPEFHLSTCTILLISPGPTDGFNHLQVLLADRNTQELLTVLEEYPFFVRDKGWSSCSPQRTADLYGLHCRQLSPGDICLALTPTPTSSRPMTKTTLTPMPNTLSPLATLSSSVNSTMTSQTPSLTSLPSPMTSSSSTPTSLQQHTCVRISAGSETSTYRSDRTAPPLAQSISSDSRREIQDKPRFPKETLVRPRVA